MKIFTLTTKAKLQLDKLMVEENCTENHFLRVSVKGGGCSGLTYDLDFDDKIVELSTKVVVELFKTLWQRKGFWESALKSVK